MATSGSSSRANMTVETARAALKDLLAAFSSPENMSRMDEAKDTAGNDMLKTMQFVFPIATEIQMDVIQNYGFSRDGKGAIQFALSIRTLEKEDPEVARLNSEVRAIFIPPMKQTSKTYLQT